MFRKFGIGVCLALAGCAASPVDCDIFPRASSDYRHCRAEQGSKEYQFRAGMEYFVKSDFKRAREWLVKSANDTYLKRSEEFGPGISVAEGRYNRTTREIIEDGNEAAAFMMAKIYNEGLGVKSDTDRAQEFIRRASGKMVEIEEKSANVTVTVKSRSRVNVNPGDEPRYFELYSFEIVTF